ncbi:Uncharacterized protein APZ42_019204 [Daphnia magna]|uniref:Uncharacterized protein n=1 Tax=Daphnia magna TaxID=35525 RepID=A0A164YDW8_9CRUS|nr:Uncharacterized protein APZ42_019204 [Daphnia magna]
MWNGTSALRNPLKSIGSIIATVAGVIGFLIILFVICCCICPCCILYKRRTAGTVYRSTVIPNSTGPSSVNVTVVPAPGAGMAQGPPPVGFTAQPGGNQGTGYPVQPNYAPQPGYPVQPNYHQQPDVTLNIAKISVREVSRPDWRCVRWTPGKVGTPRHHEPTGNRTTDIGVTRRMRNLSSDPPYIPPIDI